MGNKAFTITPTIIAYVAVASLNVYNAAERLAFACGIQQAVLNVETAIETIECQDAKDEEPGDQALLVILAEVREWAGDAIIYLKDEYND